MTFDYLKNTVLSFTLALLVFVPFYLFFGNTIYIWSAIAVVGVPHFIIGALGYLARDTKNSIKPFLGAVFFGLIFSAIYYKFFPLSLQFFVFLAYFVWHMLLDEQMFEATIKKGAYKIWTNDWPIAISWGSVALVLLSLAIATVYHISLLVAYVPLLWMGFLISAAVLIYGVLTNLDKKESVPWGYLGFFVGIFVPGILIIGRFWQGFLYTPPVVLALYHFMVWYLFYTKRLNKYPKDIVEEPVKNFFFGWRKNNFNFWRFVVVLQIIFLGLFLLYFFSPFKYPAGYLISPYLAPFWTILHVTTSFLPNKPLVFKLRVPRFSKSAFTFRT